MWVKFSEYDWEGGIPWRRHWWHNYQFRRRCKWQEQLTHCSNGLICTTHFACVTSVGNFSFHCHILLPAPPCPCPQTQCTFRKSEITHCSTLLWLLVDAETWIPYVCLDPVWVPWHTCVDSRVTGAPTAHAPWHNACNKYRKAWIGELRYFLLSCQWISTWQEEKRLHIIWKAMIVSRRALERIQLTSSLLNQ